MTTIVAPPWEERPTEGGIVAASALPLPDVWAPLSDSLRMITGYGRDVLVGSDVVARMVNFSRSTTATYIGKDGLLKTAAVNEPRFEKEGLLIEGQSTNLFLYSKSPDSYTWSRDGDSSYIKIADGVRITGTGYYSYKVLPVTAGQAYTFSVTCKVLSGTLDKVGLEGDAVLTLGSGLTPENGTVRLSGTVTPNVNSLITCVYYPTQNSVVEFTDIQFEALPFASSYIPTNGAAVTRAADEWNIPNKINCGPSPALPMSVAVNFTCMGYVNYNNIFVAGGRQLMVYVGTNKLLVEQGGYPQVNLTSNSVGYGGAQNKLRAACSDSRTACILNGILTESSGGLPIVGSWNDTFGSSNTRKQFGHIRDLRIWRIALTNEQLKAIA